MRWLVVKTPPRFELGSRDSKSRVLTVTPWLTPFNSKRMGHVTIAATNEILGFEKCSTLFAKSRLMMWIFFHLITAIRQYGNDTAMTRQSYGNDTAMVLYRLLGGLWHTHAAHVYRTQLPTDQNDNSPRHTWSLFTTIAISNNKQTNTSSTHRHRRAWCLWCVSLPCVRVCVWSDNLCQCIH